MSKDPTELGKELIAGADPEAIAKVMPASRASSLAVSAVPPESAESMLARAGSPTRRAM